jgi:hypothetical protein
VSDSAKIEWVRAHGAALARLPARIDEGFDSAAIASAPESIVIFDFAGVTAINSKGVGLWVKGLRGLRTSYCGFVNCHPIIITQCNTVSNFATKAELITFFSPYVCDDCGEFEVFVDRRIPDATQALLAGDPQPCPKCGKEAEFDDLPEVYFSHVASQPEPRVPAVVERLLVDGAGGGNEKMTVRKELLSDSVVLRLSGRLDGRARFDRLLAGAEGVVLLDASELTGIDPQASLAGLKSTESTRILCVDLPGPVLDALTPAQAEVLRGSVVSVLAPGACSACHLAQRARVTHPAAKVDSVVRCARCLEPVLPDATASVATELLAADLAGSAIEWLTLRSEDSHNTAVTAPTTVAGRYELVRLIGRGGMGEVFLARQHGPAGFEKEIVIKQVVARTLGVEATLSANLLREARLAARVSHPNVVQVLDVGRDGDTYFVAMEYVRGADLRAILRTCAANKREIPIEVAMRIIADVCAGLAAAHHCVDSDGRTLTIVHCDMSPENVLVSREGTVKVSDFGLASLASELATKENRAVYGKPRYFAPEQITPGGTADTRTDLFATGIIAFELLTLTHPFDRASEWDTMNAIGAEQAPSVRSRRPECPADIDAIVARALAREPGKRFASAKEMHVAIEESLVTRGRANGSSVVAGWLSGLIELIAASSAQSRSETIPV